MQPQSRKGIKALLKDVYVGDKRYGITLSTIEKLRVDNRVALIVLEMMESLPNREQAALSLKYGITGKSPMSLEEIAWQLGKVADSNTAISKGRAGQIVARGLRMMRNPRRGGKIIALLQAISN
jgi:DNA-directed RNA polymerase sigma subunit (sigma70/sigma32)